MALLISLYLHISMYSTRPYGRGVQSKSWKDTFLKSLAPTLQDILSNPEDLDLVVQICLTRVRAKLNKKIVLQKYN